MKWTVMLMVPLLAGSGGCAEQRDRFGGWTGVKGQATGFFHTEQVQGVWWLITPEGNAFFSKGVNHISYTADHAPALGYAPYGRCTQAKYGSAAKWAEATAARLTGWGFNTVGAWSGAEMFGQRLPYVVILNLAASAGANWQHGKIADVFAPGFAAALKQQAEKLCTPRSADPFLLGYFTDNELRWGPDWRSKLTHLEEFLTLPAETPGRQAALKLIRERYATVEALNQALGTQLKSFDELTTLPMTTDAAKTLAADFQREYARTYFAGCREAIRAADPNHLILGCRFAGHAPEPVVQAMGPYLDVVSFNNYDPLPPAKTLAHLAEVTGKPVALTEFSFKAQDSGLPNTKGAGKPVPTQQDRADHFDQYVTALARLPYVVGFHWFEYADEPKEGRFDGENSNYGLVNLNDEPWQVLTERMTQVNAGVEAVHQSAAETGMNR